MKQESEKPRRPPVKSTMPWLGVMKPVSPGSVSLMGEAGGRLSSIRK